MDTQLKMTFCSIRNGFTTMCNTRFNYTNGYWYNFKSYMYGNENLFTLCSHCNNYKRINNDVNSYSDMSYIKHPLCDCAIFGFRNQLFEKDNDASSAECVLDDILDDEFDDNFIYITSGVCDYRDNDLKRSVVF